MSTPPERPLALTSLCEPQPTDDAVGVLSPPSSSSYRGWARPGPVPPGGVEIEEGESLDFLCGHWKIFQYQRGHRYSTDDVLCAFYATSWAPRVERYCDLGSGIGSVAQLVAWRLPGARTVTVEAQEISLRLAHKTAKYNGVDVTFHHGDLRDVAVLDDALKSGPFNLVTGSPPYWPVGTALPPVHAQAIPARLEVRGDVADYAQAAARILAVGGMFVCVFGHRTFGNDCGGRTLGKDAQASQDARVRCALDDAGLVLLRSRRVVFKEGAEAGVVLYAAARAQDVPSTFPRRGAVVDGKPVAEPPLVIRRADGSTHPEYATVRLSFGFPPGDVADAHTMRARH